MAMTVIVWNEALIFQRHERRRDEKVGRHLVASDGNIPDGGHLQQRSALEPNHREVEFRVGELSAMKKGGRLPRMSRTFTPPGWSHHGSQPKQADDYQKKDERGEQEECSPHAGKHTDLPPSLSIQTPVHPYLA